jgi:hypothetical protein
VFLFLVYIEIFALAAMKSGRKSWLQVIDANGNVIHETDGKNLSDFNKYYFEKLIAAVSRFNIFTIGFLVLLGVFSYWVVPNFIVHVGKLGVETLTRYKWIFLSFGMILLGVVIWVIYLKYLLAKKAIESHAEIDKYRLQIEFDHGNRYPLRLVHDQKETTDTST